MKQLSGNIEQRLFSRGFVRIITVCAVLGFVISAVSLLPAFQNSIIRFAEETLIHRLINHEKWLRRLFSMLFFLISITALAVAFLVSIEDNKMKKIQIVFPVVLLFLIVSYSSSITYRYGHHWLNSDISAELLGAKTLAEENALFSSKWHYGTEFWFIYRQPFAILLFKICNNWPLIRAVNSFFQLSVLILSFLFMMRQTKVALKYSLLASCFLIVPLSERYWDIVLVGLYYNHFFIKIFLMTGCFLAFLQRKEKRTAGILYTILWYALAFLTGAEGIRIFYSFLLPLVLAVFFAAHFDVIKEKTVAYRTIFTALALSSLGYLVNKLVLENFFTFAIYDREGSFISIGSDFFDKLSSRFFDAYAVFWGYKPVSILSMEGFLSTVSLLFFAVSIAGFVIYIKNICTVRKKQLFLELCRNYSVECFLLLYIIAAMLFNLVFFMFSGHYFALRYLYPVQIFLFAAIPVFLILYYMRKVHTPLPGALIHSFVCIVLCGFLFGHGTLLFDKISRPGANQNIDRNGYLAYLEANSLVYGFAQYWNANVTTELSNGKIEMVDLRFVFTGTGIQKDRRWLSPAKFDNPYYHKGQAFLLLEKKEWDALKDRVVFTNKSPAYMDDFYVVIVYPEAAVIHREIMGANF